jgi:hypothetical protein
MVEAADNIFVRRTYTFEHVCSILSGVILLEYNTCRAAEFRIFLS